VRLSSDQGTNFDDAYEAMALINFCNKQNRLDLSTKVEQNLFCNFVIECVTSGHTKKMR